MPETKEKKPLPAGRQAKAPEADNPFAAKNPTKAPTERKKRSGAVSEYKKSLVEKQTLKNLYGLSEKQCKKYVQEALEKMGRIENVSDELIKHLEKRLDNVVFRLGFAKTRAMARQMVGHAYFTINGKPVNIPSYQVQKGDIIAVKETKKKKMVFGQLSEELKKQEPHVWLKLNKEKWEATAVGEPSLAEVSTPVEISLVFEFYSR